MSPLAFDMAFIGDMLGTADRVGELRHKRWMRQLERRRAEREAAAAQAPPGGGQTRSDPVAAAKIKISSNENP